ncbi:MAG: cyclic nucleotide-binding domain-containing protein, partial [Tannerella sp.]|nr:cyclic nucleotide-binding domain-containing protein [Tannerella sp.]
MDVIKRLSAKYNVSLSEKSIEKFASILEPKEYRKDEIILNQGQVSRYMYIVEKGIIRQFYYKDGRNITEHFSCEGDIATCLESLF